VTKAKTARGLPDKIASAVGRVTHRWALQEHWLKMILIHASGLDPKRGRIALREPRIDEHLTIVGDLLALQSIRVTVDLKALTKKLASAKERRNLITHSVWVRHDGVLGVQETRGTWELGPGKPRASKKMWPAFQPVDRNYLVKLRKDIDETIRLSFGLMKEICDAQAAMRKKSR